MVGDLLLHSSQFPLPKILRPICLPIQWHPRSRTAQQLKYRTGRVATTGEAVGNFRIDSLGAQMLALLYKNIYHSFIDHKNILN